MTILEQNDKKIGALQKKQTKILLATVFLTSIVTLFFFLLSMYSLSVHHREIMLQTAKITKQRDLMDTVNNTIVRIDFKNNELISEKEQLIASIKEGMLHRREKLDDMIKKLDYLSTLPIYLGINIVIFSDNNEIVYSNNKNEMGVSNKSQLLEVFQIEPAIFEMFDINDLSLVLQVDKQFIENEVKNDIKKVVHELLYSKNQYIWVNKILDFDGGNNYAIRRIHPNLRDTEGEYLSTNTEDIKGNLPYQVELDGIKEEGEITFEYYFKNLDSDKIEKKITYAKLYKNYNWIVATGIPISEIEGYMAILKEESLGFILRLVFFTFIAIVLSHFLSLFCINRIVKTYDRRVNKVFYDETQKDMLTGCFNRKMGDKFLNNAFSDFITNKINCAIFLLDIDDFKQVNDKWGHDVGDIVLKKMVAEIETLIGKNNKLIRWGGEEFVVVCQDVVQDQYRTLATEIVKKISRIPFRHAESEFNVSVSMGVSLFEETDESYQDSLKRADIGLYYVKNNGKNLCKFYENHTCVL